MCYMLHKISFAKTNISKSILFISLLSFLHFQPLQLSSRIRKEDVLRSKSTEWTFFFQIFQCFDNVEATCFLKYKCVIRNFQDFFSLWIKNKSAYITKSESPYACLSACGKRVCSRLRKTTKFGTNMHTHTLICISNF